MARVNKRSGLTLVEVVLAAAILMVALVGGMAYRYYATLDARKADIMMTASRNAMMLLESWRGAGGGDLGTGNGQFDPTSLTSTGFTITSTGAGPGVPPSSGFINPGNYKITTDNVVYYVTLSIQPTVAGVTPKALNVRICWRMDRSGSGWQDAAKARDPIGFTTYMSN
jgi:hypothetical protein